MEMADDQLPGEVSRLLRRFPETLYGLFDAARNPKILPLLRESKERCQSLYEGIPGDELAAFAPYLLCFKSGSPFLDVLLQEGWGDSWGVFLTSASPFEDLRRHFRHFLLVQTEAGKSLYFRFYDPRVLRTFLPTCTKAETDTFFGPVEAFWMENQHADRLLRFSSGPAGAFCSTNELGPLPELRPKVA